MQCLTVLRRLLRTKTVNWTLKLLYIDYDAWLNRTKLSSKGNCEFSSNFRNWNVIKLQVRPMRNAIPHAIWIRPLRSVVQVSEFPPHRQLNDKNWSTFQWQQFDTIRFVRLNEWFPYAVNWNGWIFVTSRLLFVLTFRSWGEIDNLTRVNTSIKRKESNNKSQRWTWRNENSVFPMV